MSDHVKFELIDYRQLDGQFDRIVSVGMFEHVGAAHYDEFFAKCRELLKPDGVMLLHTIGKLGEARARPTRSPTNISSPATICRRCRRWRREREGAADRQRRRERCGCIMPTRCATGSTARRKARGEIVADVRRALLPHVGILPRRRDRDVRERRRLQLPGAIYPRPHARSRSRAIIWSRPSSAIASWQPSRRPEEGAHRARKKALEPTGA